MSLFRPLQASEKRPEAPKKPRFRAFSPSMGNPSGYASPARHAAFLRDSAHSAFSAPDGHRPCRPVPRPAGPFWPGRPDWFRVSAPRASRASASRREALRGADESAQTASLAAFVLFLVFAFSAHCASFACQQLSLLRTPRTSRRRGRSGIRCPSGDFACTGRSPSPPGTSPRPRRTASSAHGGSTSSCSTPSRAPRPA